MAKGKVVSIRSGYSGMLANPHRVVERATDKLRDVSFDTIVGTGTSGLLMLPALAEHFDVSYLAVRKPNDNSHATDLVEGELGERWIFVDDFTSSMKTLARCYYAVETAAHMYRANTRFVGAYLYQYNDYYDADHYTERISRWERDSDVPGEVRRRPLRDDVWY